MAYKLLGVGPDVPIIGVGNAEGLMMIGQLDAPTGTLVPMLGPAGRGYTSVERDGTDIVFTATDLSTETIALPEIADAADAAAASATAAAGSATAASGSATAAAGSAFAAETSETNAAASETNAGDLAAIAGAAATTAVQAAEETVVTVGAQVDWTGSLAMSSVTVSAPRWVKVRLVGNVNATIPAGTSGVAYTVTLEVAQDGAGNRTLAFVGVSWAYGVPPTITATANARDLLYLTWTGSQWVGAVGAQAVA